MPDQENSFLEEGQEKDGQKLFENVNVINTEDLQFIKDKIIKEINYEGEHSLGRQKISIMAAIQAISKAENKLPREEIEKLAEDYKATINKAEEDIFHATQNLNVMINSLAIEKGNNGKLIPY